MFKIFTLLLISFSALAHEKATSFHQFKSDPDCKEQSFVHNKVLTLEVKTSFSGSYSFKVCRVKDQHYMVSSHFAAQNSSNYQIPEQLTISNLTKVNRDEILQQYKKSLVYSVNDLAYSMDGSTWCLESHKYSTYSKVCFKNPSSNHEKRKTTEFIILSKLLIKNSGLKSAENLIEYL